MPQLAVWTICAQIGIAIVARFRRQSAVNVFHTSVSFDVVRQNSCRCVALWHRNMFMKEAGVCIFCSLLWYLFNVDWDVVANVLFTYFSWTQGLQFLSTMFILKSSFALINENKQHMICIWLWVRCPRRSDLLFSACYTNKTEGFALSSHKYKHFVVFFLFANNSWHGMLVTTSVEMQVTLVLGHQQTVWDKIYSKLAPKDTCDDIYMGVSHAVWLQFRSTPVCTWHSTLGCCGTLS